MDYAITLNCRSVTGRWHNRYLRVTASSPRKAVRSAKRIARQTETDVELDRVLALPSELPTAVLAVPSGIADAK